MTSDAEPSPRQASPTRTETPAMTFRIRDGLIIVAVLLVMGYVLRSLLRKGWITGGLTGQLTVAGISKTLVILVVVWLARRRGVSLKRLILKDSARWPIEVLWGLGLAFFVSSVGTALWWFQILPVDPLARALAGTSLFVRWQFFISAVILAPLSEELLFRGLIQSSLVPRLGLLFACGAQAALFGLSHPRGGVVMASAFVAGLVMGALALWRGCLLAAMAAHAGGNAVGAIWLVALVWINTHTPAANMAEAHQKPAWWDDPPLLAIPEEPTAQRQYKLTVWRFGTRGAQLWKNEIKAFASLRRQFPENDEYGARALVGIQEVYLRYLDDPRRAVVTGQQVFEEYPDQTEMQAQAVLRIIEAYVKLDHFEKARQWIERAKADYGDLEGIPERLERLREVLNSQQAAEE